MIYELDIPVTQQGLHAFTDLLRHSLGSLPASGLCTLFIRHTSASLLIQENYDPSAKHDLEQWLNRLVPDNDPLFTHTLEGSDDMPAHIKSALTATSISIPIMNRQLALGTWQGVYLWEHRHYCGQRRVVVHLLSD